MDLPSGQTKISWLSSRRGVFVAFFPLRSTVCIDGWFITFAFIIECQWPNGRPYSIDTGSTRDEIISLIPMRKRCPDPRQVSNWWIVCNQMSEFSATSEDCNHQFVCAVEERRRSDVSGNVAGFHLSATVVLRHKCLAQDRLLHSGELLFSSLKGIYSKRTQKRLLRVRYWNLIRPVIVDQLVGKFTLWANDVSGKRFAGNTQWS